MNYQDHQRLRNSQGRPQFLPPAEPWILPVLSIWPEPEDCWGVMVVVRDKHKQIGGLALLELTALMEYFRDDPEFALGHWFDLRPPSPMAKGASRSAGPLATTDQSLEDLDL